MSVVQRDIIGIFGRMNVGKSSLLNLIVQYEASIVDETPGTTADTKEVLCEIHGIGPVKLLDTAGIDEGGLLGEKKRKKVYENLKECDCAIVVVDPSKDNFLCEKDLIEYARRLDKQVLLVLNIFQETRKNNIDQIYHQVSSLAFYPSIQIKANDKKYAKAIVEFISTNYKSKRTNIPLIPFLKSNEFYVLIIPIDEESPKERLLRPQAMVLEYITRHWAYPVCFRLNVSKVRESQKGYEEEYARFNNFINSLRKVPHCIFTDSQAVDILAQWCPNTTYLTTFSIVMIHYQSGGKLHKCIEGVKALETLQHNDIVLIAEACNHNRIAEDIGTVQIPKLLFSRYPYIAIEHLFGKHIMDIAELKKYSLVIHCGGCMIAPQTMQSRLRDFEIAGIPYTNYGIVLSYLRGPEVLKKVMQPWNIYI